MHNGQLGPGRLMKVLTSCWVARTYVRLRNASWRSLAWVSDACRAHRWHERRSLFTTVDGY